ncbi:glutathione S-transferase family protein [Parahaliea mediterranea]|uniref:Glutathione S-transferase family protein n=1 Tax=Parahaliea mediterranea TaxID=651086 RepID=A0A939DHQ1_9GAMM|nr:glutathione S-transferase family protein [Parahaliea mediterranea]MBN7798056.1 glutathione S-transferase family protein [Parahaliea mediterranea]
MSSPRLIIANRNYSSWSLRAWLCLRKSGVAFEEELLPLDTPEFAARIGDLSPSRTVPALWHDGRCIWDSLAICEYVNEQFAAGGLWPADPGSRALGRAMVAEMHSGFGHLRAAMPMNFRARNRAVPQTEGLRGDIRRMLALWQGAREAHADAGPWLLGEFSIADAFFAPVVVRFGGYGVALPPGLLAGYGDTLRRDPDFRHWQSQAARETWVVEADEAGQECDS